ncbi:MAG: hypothetical protein ACTSVV_17480 [Promethearchaeota archaeon]
MSFFLDWWMLIVIGVVIALFSKIFYKEDSFLKYTLSIIALVVFFTFSIALFCQLNGKEHGFLGALNDFFWGFVKDVAFKDYYQKHPNATSTEFMYSSGIEQLKPYVPFDDLEGLVKHPLHLFFGICMFISYPGWLYLGTQLGFLLFGRKPGDKGALGFL